MNTWLPDPDFAKSAEILDLKRLNRQRSDVLNVLKACCEPKPEQQREHPAITMWRGSEQRLIQYGVAICLEWRARGNSDNLLPRIMDFVTFFPEGNVEPEWLGDEPFHRSHQSYLLRLLPSWYSKFFPDLRDDLPMVWPRVENKVSAERLERERVKNVARAKKAREKANKAVRDARLSAFEAGLHPDTLDPLTAEEAALFKIEFKDPNEDQLELLSETESL